MMQDGLHIGLAAWINGQRNTGSFPVYPTMPIVTELVNLEAVQNISDLAKAAEFARLVSFVPRQGQVADTFSESTVLWRIHRDILSQMDFATRPWTGAQQVQYKAALEVLYSSNASGQPTPSQKLLLYAEMRNAYQDLSKSGGSESEITEAMTNWMVLGFKQEIDDAFEVITRLSSRSSRYQAQNETFLLNEDPMGVGLRSYGDMEFAPTYFAPISAIARETWMQAKVSFDDLDRAVGDDRSSNGKWKAYRANRRGEVLFDYVVLQCLRPWYTPALYQADDWKLSTEGKVVSKGNGYEGLFPAYVGAVYLTSIKNVTIASKPSLPISDSRSVIIPPSIRLPSEATIGAKVGVVKKIVNTPIAVRKVSISNGVGTTQLSRIDKPSVVTTPPNPVKLGAVKRLSTQEMELRYTVARGILERKPWVVPSPGEDTIPMQIHVVGFGCEKLPFAPNPNINYQW